MEETQSLVFRAKDGDRQAFGELYALVWSDLYRFALYTLRSRQEAEDAVQEAVSEAYACIGSLREESAFRRWIFTILARCCKRRLRDVVAGRKNISIEELENQGVFLKREAGGIDERAMVWDALDSLSQSERLIVLLSVIGDYTSGELAVMLHRPPGTIRSQLSRSLRKLRNIL